MAAATSKAGRYPPCRTCGAEGEKICQRCKIARYCSAECQREDWKKHKHVCGANTTEEQRAILVTCTLDLRRILPDDVVRRSLEHKEPLFFTSVFLPVPDQASCGIGQVAGVLTRTHDIAALSFVVTSTLKTLSSTLSMTSNSIFSHPRDGGSLEDLGMPLGVPHAVSAYARDAQAILLEAPSHASVAARHQQFIERVGQAERPGFWAGTSASSEPRTAPHAAEASLYDADFMDGATNLVAYDSEIVQVGGQATVLHFSSGLFYKRVDFCACRRGLAADRVMCHVPHPMQIDCRNMRKVDAKADGAVVASCAEPGSPEEEEVWRRMKGRKYSCKPSRHSAAGGGT